MHWRTDTSTLTNVMWWALNQWLLPITTSVGILLSSPRNPFTTSIHSPYPHPALGNASAGDMTKQVNNVFCLPSASQSSRFLILAESNNNYLGRSLGNIVYRLTFHYLQGAQWCVKMEHRASRWIINLRDKIKKFLINTDICEYLAFFFIIAIYNIMLVAYLLLKTPRVCYSVTWGIWAKAMPISGVVSDESKLGFQISLSAISLWIGMSTTSSQ